MTPLGDPVVMLVEHLFEALGFGGPDRRLVFSELRPSACGRGIMFEQYSEGVLLPRAM